MNNRLGTMTVAEVLEEATAAGMEPGDWLTAQLFASLMSLAMSNPSTGLSAAR